MHGTIRACDTVSSPRSHPHPSQFHSVVSSRRHLLAWTAIGGPYTFCWPRPVHSSTVATEQEWNYHTNASQASGWKGSCSTGAAQSPIDISSPPNIKRLEPCVDALRPRYPRFVKAGAFVSSSGRGSPQIAFPPEDFILEVGQRQYQLVQLHFHTPSEHTIDGVHFPVEAHLVHREVTTGDLAVVAVLMRTGVSNQVVDAALGSAPSVVGSAVPLDRAFSLTGLLPPPASRCGGRRYATYEGSLTTPPCTERVRWFILLDSVQVSAQQVLELMSFGNSEGLLDTNSRPTQPLNGREVQYAL
jgi:carbonic anhydrase